jgi:plasmid stabilization system protein ParE
MSWSAKVSYGIMGLPAELLDALDSLYAQGSTEPPAQEELRPTLNFVEGRYRRAFKQLDQHLETLEAKIRVFSEAASSFLQRVTEHLAAGASLDLDEAVEAMEEWEANLREGFLPLLRQAEKAREDVPSLPPRYRELALQIADKQIKVYSGILESLRDARWQLMALRAKAEGPGDGLVFDDPEELERYLETL